MSEIKRRKFLKTSAGLAAGAAAGPLIWTKSAHAQGGEATPEKKEKTHVVHLGRFGPGSP